MVWEKLDTLEILKIKKKIQTHYKALNENKHIDLICVVENKKINLKNKKVKIYKNINKIKFLDFELAVVAVPTKDHFKVLKFNKFETIKNDIM